VKANFTFSRRWAKIAVLKGIEGTGSAASLDVGQSFGQLGVDDAALLGSVFVVCGGELWKNGNHAAGRLELQHIAKFKAGPVLDSLRHGDSAAGFSFGFHSDLSS